MTLVNLTTAITAENPTPKRSALNPDHVVNVLAGGDGCTLQLSTKETVRVRGEFVQVLKILREGGTLTTV